MSRFQAGYKAKIIIIFQYSFSFNHKMHGGAIGPPLSLLSLGESFVTEFALHRMLSYMHSLLFVADAHLKEKNMYIYIVLFPLNGSENRPCIKGLSIN